MEHDQFPIQFQKFTLLEDDWQYYSLFEETFNSRIQALKKAMDQEMSDIQEMVYFIVRDMGLRGIQTCLRMRKTVGSIRYLIPTHSDLIHAFSCQTMSGGSGAGGGLTVGARALAKHCHRSETDKWWGGSNILKGNAQEKNNKALSILSKILEEATFINCHILPHNVPCIEVRNYQGYGSRWVYQRRRRHQNVHTHHEHSATPITTTLDYEDNNQIIFRGFLEPYQINGHESGWKH